jgi:nucleoside-diphosphate-sugar epimerase
VIKRQSKENSLTGTVLVTGSTGFIGSNLVRRLVRDGLDVHVLCRSSSNFWRLPDVLPQIQTHTVDLTDGPGITKLVRTLRPRHVFHLASSTVVAGSVGAPIELVNGNFLGTINIIEACDSIDHCSLVCTGDSFEYSPSLKPLRETSPCQPESLHGITKLAATLYARARARAEELPIVTLRLFSTYGPGDNPRRLVPRVIAGARAGTPILLSRPEIARDWIYVDDVVELYLEAAQRAAQVSGQVFNVGSGRKSDLKEVVETILRLVSTNAETRWGAFPVPDHDAYPWVADMGLTFRSFSWRPKISLEEGLRHTIAAS